MWNENVLFADFFKSLPINFSRSGNEGLKLLVLQGVLKTEIIFNEK